MFEILGDPFIDIILAEEDLLDHVKLHELLNTSKYERLSGTLAKSPTNEPSSKTAEVRFNIFENEETSPVMWLKDISMRLMQSIKELRFPEIFVPYKKRFVNLSKAPKLDRSPLTLVLLSDILKRPLRSLIAERFPLTLTLLDREILN